MNDVPNKSYDLKDSPFFKLKSRKKLAEVLRMSVSNIDHVLSLSSPYKRKWKHKDKKDVWQNTEPTVEPEKFRPIDIPDPILKKMQSRIGDLLGRIDPPDWLFSPVKGRSYVDNAAKHKSSKAFKFLDISNYFPNCSANNVAHFFGKKMQCSPDVTAILTKISTNKECLPQGSPCSPILAYFSNLDMWTKIAEVVARENLIHSVYADDITISGNVVTEKISWEIKKIVHGHGHRIHSGKEGASLAGRRAKITGTYISKGRVTLQHGKHKELFELRRSFHETRSEFQRKIIERQIAGRVAQKNQIDSANN